MYTMGQFNPYGGVDLSVRSDAIAIMLGYARPFPGLGTIGYSYDVSINRLSGVSAGSHEVLWLRYCYYLTDTLPIPEIETPEVVVILNYFLNICNHICKGIMPLYRSNQIL